MRPSLADHEANRLAPGNKREAKRRKAHANHVPRSISKRCRLPMRRARLRATQTSARSLRTHLLAGRARLPALRPRLSQGLPSLLSSRPCFLRLGIKRALPASILSQSSDSTSRLGRSTEGNDAQSRSGADCEPARKHRTRSTLQIASGMRPSMSEMSWLLSLSVTKVKSDVTIRVTQNSVEEIQTPKRKNDGAGLRLLLGRPRVTRWLCFRRGENFCWSRAVAQMRGGFVPIWFKPRGPRAGFRASGRPAPGRAGYRAPDNARRPLLSVWRARPRARCFADEPCRARR